MIDTDKFEKLEKEELENVAGGCGDSKKCDCGGSLTLIFHATSRDSTYDQYKCENCQTNYRLFPDGTWEKIDF